MYQHYVQAPHTPQPLTILKGNVVVEKANPDSIPAGYQKDLKQKIKSILYEIEWQLRRFRKDNNNDYQNL